MKYIAIIPFILFALTGGAQEPSEKPHQGRQQDRNLSTRGERPTSSMYIIDGVAVQPNMQKEEIAPLPAYNTPGNFRLNRSEIRTLPATDIRDIVALTTTVYQQQRGADICVRGGQPNDVLYIIDGMQIARN